MSWHERVWAAVLLVVALAIVAGSVLAAAPRRQYVHVCAGTVDGMMRAVNMLSPEEQAGMHLFTVPSERNFGGLMGSPYCVAFPK